MKNWSQGAHLRTVCYLCKSIETEPTSLIREFTAMAANRNCIRDLEEMRVELKHFFLTTMLLFTTPLLGYADELDAAYRDIKISKVSGQSGCVVGGVLFVVGFGLSFVTFGASLGLCIAGGIIGGAGGIVTGGASIADAVKSSKARTKAKAELDKCNTAFNEILMKCNRVSTQLENVGNIDINFPVWCSFWGNLMLGTGRTLSGFGWQMVASTVLNAIRLGRAVDIASDVTSAVVPVFRTLGNAAKGLHIAGGVVSAVFLPIDIGFLVYNSIELHKDESHDESKKIREAVAKLQNRCPSEQDIDEMIDSCINSLRQLEN
ncbi:uncharacterized protein LOC132728966 isoform X1 [Ruditapes philippinarum]|uniref:uncharacterized protein LOC132728966 isoform X1 n=2 Tax=Ruditapes philippinarum TaxID=129788 RepID=UPI00295AEBA5|nr:uncharacterized protein LOC132728966 isoform X1 [Ruditapes philippinarum]